LSRPSATRREVRVGSITLADLRQLQRHRVTLAAASPATMRRRGRAVNDTMSTPNARDGRDDGSVAEDELKTRAGDPPRDDLGSAYAPEV